MAQFLIQMPAVIKKGWIYKPILDFKDRGVKKIFALMTPAVFAQSVTQINIIVVNTIMAGLLGKAAITYLYYGNRLMQLPLGVFAVAIATATLPVISRNITRERPGGGDQKLFFRLAAGVFYSHTRHRRNGSL